MYSPLSSRFEPFLHSSGKRISSVDIYYKGNLLQSDVAVSNINISSDANSDVRRQGTIDLVLSPDSSPDDILAALDSVFGQEVVVKTGVQYANDDTELIPLGVFMVWVAEIDYTQGNIITMELYDRAKYLSQSGIPKFYDASGKTATQAIQDLVTMGLPVNQTVSFGAGLPVVTMPGGTMYDGTHLEAILDLAEQLGAEFFFDLSGQAVCQIKPTISPTATVANAQWIVATGDNGVITELGRRTSREGVANGVGVYGGVIDAATPQAYAEVYDLDSTSKTFYGGPFGKTFKRIDRPELLTNADCLAAANAELKRSIIGARNSTLGTLPNPALEPGDLIAITYPDNTVELHMIDSIDFDVDEQDMQLTTRSQNV